MRGQGEEREKQNRGIKEKSPKVMKSQRQRKKDMGKKICRKEAEKQKVV